MYTIIEQIPAKEGLYKSKNIEGGYLMVSKLDGEHICVDATFYNHFGRYINHCCSPGNNAVPVWLTTTNRLAIEAERDIKVS